MVVIHSIEDERISSYRSLRDLSPRRNKAEETVFVVENSKVIRRLLKSSCDVCSFFATAAYYEEFCGLLDAKNVPDEMRFVADDTVMNAIVGFSLHEGVMALAKAPQMPYLLDSLRSIEFPAVCLCGVIDAENVGAIVRNCAAFGIRSLIIDAASSSPYLRRAVRVSLGGIFALKVYQTDSVREALEELKQRRPSLQRIALETRPDATLLPAVAVSEECIICFGSEAKGIPEEILHAVDTVATIPMPAIGEFDAVNSLNVASSTAIALYHLTLKSV